MWHAEEQYVNLCNTKHSIIYGSVDSTDDQKPVNEKELESFYDKLYKSDQVELIYELLNDNESKLTQDFLDSMNASELEKLASQVGLNTEQLIKLAKDVNQLHEKEVDEYVAKLTASMQ